MHLNKFLCTYMLLTICSCVQAITYTTWRPAIAQSFCPNVMMYTGRSRTSLGWEHSYDRFQAGPTINPAALSHTLLSLTNEMQRTIIKDHA